MVRFTSEYIEAALKHRQKTTTSADPEFLIGTVRVDVKLLENVRSEATMRHFKWSSDEPSERGGGDTAPHPLAYFLSGLGFCQAVQWAGEAARNGITLESLENTLRGRYDRGTGRRFLEFIYDLQIESADPPEKIRAMVETGERFCFVSNTLATSARITGNIFLNGKPFMTLSRGPETQAPALPKSSLSTG